MSIEILDLTNKNKRDKTQSIALPVLAYECEATPPLENYIDVYEETVLKLTNIGLSSSGISKTLNAKESLIEEILTGLEIKGYANKEHGKPWEITEDGKKFLDGEINIRASEHTQFGYMFVNSIKKDILPFFFQGDLNQAPLSSEFPLPFTLTRAEGEEKTFEDFQPKQRKLTKAYKKFHQLLKISQNYIEHEIEHAEAVDLFENLDSFDEEIEESVIEVAEPIKLPSLSPKMFIRPLNKPPKKAYLTLRLILDPCYPGGYRVESPFNFKGIDDNYYLRQIQWFAAEGNTLINGEKLNDFLIREIQHVAPDFSTDNKDFSVFVLEKMPLLKLYRDKFPIIYDDMGRIYALIQKQHSLLEKENIVNNISRNIIESLYNTFFKRCKQSTLFNIQVKAKNDLAYFKKNRDDCGFCLQQYTQGTTLDATQFQLNYNSLINISNRLPYTHGNSIFEKLINVILLNYYFETKETNAFLSQKNAQTLYNLTNQLNLIRRKVAHDTDQRFETKDYDFYMANAFTLINGLLEAFKEV